MSERKPDGCLVDGHVHLYPLFDRVQLLDRARDGFDRAAAAAGLDPAATGVLCHVAGTADDVFADLARTPAVGRWTVRPTAAGDAVWLDHPDRGPLLVVAGRQVVSGEGLEVLALACPAPIRAGAPLAATVTEIRAAGGIPVLPWGVGKWWGRRGRILEQFLGSPAGRDVALGDIGGRPAAMPPPRSFHGRVVLAGSDPLPLAAEARRVGSYGFVLASELGRADPAAELRSRLRALTTSPAAFGRRVTAPTFVARQSALRATRPRRRRHGLAHDVVTPDVETASDGYARRFAGPVGQYFLGVQEGLVRDLLAPLGPGPLRILEVGGGHAQLTPALLALGHEVVVQGSTPAALARTAALAPAGRLQPVVAELWSLPFADRSVDVAIAIRLLAHVEAADALLAEMARVSRRLVVVDFPPRVSANLLEPALFALKRRLEGNTRPFFCYHPGRLRRVLASHGFARAEVRKSFFLPMVVHRTAGRPGLSERLEGAGRRLGLTRLLGAPALLAAERTAEPDGA